MINRSDRMRAPGICAARVLLVLLLILLAGCDTDSEPTPPPLATATAPPAPPIVPATPTGAVLVIPTPTVPAPEATPTLPRPPERAAVGYAAPNFSATRLSDGTHVRLSELRGKAVWINFWATTCEPCRVEMPVMQKLYDKHKDQLEIIGVSVAEGPTTATRYIKEYGYTWTFIMDAGVRINSRYHAAGLPTHVFINREGLITKLAYGALGVAQMNGYLAEILDQ